MNQQKNPFVFVVDDDASIRDSLSRSSCARLGLMYRHLRRRESSWQARVRKR